MEIDILLSYKNFVIIRDKITGYIHAYSYNKPIARLENYHLYVNTELLSHTTNHFHLQEFKKFLHKNS